MLPMENVSEKKKMIRGFTMRGNFLKDFYKDDGNTVAFGGLIPKVVYQEVK
jgi:hypothetical protein